MRKLNAKQKQAAKQLLQERPPVITGTCAIIDRELCLTWYNRVTATMKKLKLDDAQVSEFCDIAGVAN